MDVGSERAEVSGRSRLIFGSRGWTTRTVSSCSHTLSPLELRGTVVGLVSHETAQCLSVEEGRGRDSAIPGRAVSHLTRV